MDAEQHIERAYQRLVHKLERVTDELERIGEQDMGLLHLPLAMRFHRATAKLVKLTHELKQDAYWPRED